MQISIAGMTESTKAVRNVFHTPKLSITCLLSKYRKAVNIGTNTTARVRKNWLPNVRLLIATNTLNAHNIRARRMARLLPLQKA